MATIVHANPKLLETCYYRKPDTMFKEAHFKERFCVFDPSIGRILIFHNEEELHKGSKPIHKVKLGRHLTEVN